jgi:co-chaperonin GroES (HSP10)
MAEFIQGVKDKIICEVLQEEKISDGGIIIPETAQKSPQVTCKVVSVGKDVTEIVTGDIIYCHQRGGMDMMIKGKIYKILKFDEVYGVLKTS